MTTPYSQADKDRVVKIYARMRRMYPDECDSTLMIRAGETIGAARFAVSEWVMKAGLRKLRVRFSEAERRAAAECYENLSRRFPDRPAKEIGREVAYAFGISTKTLRHWTARLTTYRRPKFSPLHPWYRDNQRHFRERSNGHGGLQTSGS